MKRLGNDIYIQRGEVLTLDFAVTNAKGDPFMVFQKWKNPYLVFTVSSSQYKQDGDYREVHWLDLVYRYEQQDDGTLKLELFKRFIGTEVLYGYDFVIGDIQKNYPHIKFDHNDSDFDVQNYLFYSVSDDGEKVYRFVSSYTIDDDDIISVVWEEYNFRIVMQFDTEKWVEQRYLLDVKLLAGQSVKEYLIGILDSQGVDYTNPESWGDMEWEKYIASIKDVEIQKCVRHLYDSGVPLMPDYDTMDVILSPTNVFVNVNLQGGMV